METTYKPLRSFSFEIEDMNRPVDFVTVYAYFYSNGDNYTPVGENNFSLYHRNTSMFAFGVGSTF